MSTIKHLPLMSTFSLTINHWAAWMPGITTGDDWLQWAVDEKHPTKECELPKVSEMPPMLRRRLSPLGKIALYSAFSAVIDAQNKSVASIFCSRHGDLQRTVSLLKDLSYQQPLSPAHFSLSVYNAIPGLMSIARKDNGSITALACGQHDIANVFLEAKGIMDEQGISEVLCVIYDEPIPDIYNQPQQHPAYSTAFLVSNTAAHLSGDTNNSHCQPVTLSFTIENAKEKPLENDEPQALQLLRFLLQSQPLNLTLNGARNRWCCYKKPAESDQ